MKSLLRLSAQFSPRNNVALRLKYRRLSDMSHTPMDAARVPMLMHKGSQLTYWWNKETNETTGLGAPKPHHWVEVRDPAGSQLTYWWDRDSNTTTALGAPRPHHSPQQQQQGLQIGNQRGAPTSFGGAMVQMAAVGFGMSLAMIAIRSVIG